MNASAFGSFSFTVNANPDTLITNNTKAIWKTDQLQETFRSMRMH